MADNELHKEMVKKDVIWGLSNLAQTDNVEILSLCSKSLCRLSVKFAKVFNYSLFFSRFIGFIGYIDLLYHLI
jgi:hypothetical protein